MQNNALARIFGILFAIVSIYQLSFTFITSQQEDNAADFAAKKVLDNTEDYLEKRERTAINYLDSIGISFFSRQSFRQLRTISKRFWKESD